MKYYHGSEMLYDFPSYEEIYKRVLMPDSERALKCLLGYYVTPWRELAENLGHYVYEIVPMHCTVYLDLPFKEMRDQYMMTCDMTPEAGTAFYTNLRDKYLNEGVDIIRVVESAGSVGELVIVDFTCIGTFRRIK